MDEVTYLRVTGRGTMVYDTFADDKVLVWENMEVNNRLDG